MTEGEILAQIAKHAPTGSIIEKTLMEFVNTLQTKNGAESIDLAVFLEDLFQEAGHGDTLNEANLMDYMDFTKVADDLGKIGDVLKMLVPAVETAADQVQDHGQDMEGMGGDEEGPEEPLGSPDDMDSDQEAGMGEPNMDAEQAAEEVKGEVADEEAAAEGGEEMPEEEPKEEPEEEPEGEEEMGEEEPMEDEGEEEPEEMEQDDLTSLLSKLEDLLADIKPDDEGEEEEPEEEVEEDEEDEEEKEDPEQYKT
jgi:hypothetical protein